MTEISVLLTIRNWDLQRVRMCLASLEVQVDVDAEVVVIDFGSDNPSPIKALVTEFDVKFVRVEADEWSRSRAMNIAAREATGRLLIFADADLVFDPRVLSATRDRLEENPRSVLMFSFRDLPPTISPQDLQSDIDFETLDESAIWRPRWGMGVQAYTANAFWDIRGFDERMKIYGGEDNDIAKRARAHGYRLSWVNERQFGLYHVWHPSSRELAISNPDDKKELEKNSSIAKHDDSIIRNLDWESEANPLVSVVIVNTSESEEIRDSINSVLEQSILDFEVLIQDYSNSEFARIASESFGDERIRYLRAQDGIPSGTLFNATPEARGKYITFINCGDILLPWSLESRLKAIETGTAGSFGGSVEYSRDTGELEFIPTRHFELHSLLGNSDEFVSESLLIETDILRIVSVESRLQPLSDFDLILRFAKSGVQILHCGDFVVLRQETGMPVISNDEAHTTEFSQKLAWGSDQRSRSRELSVASEPYKYPPNLEEPARFTRYLPRSLVRNGYLIPVGASVDCIPQGVLECVITDEDGTNRRNIFTNSLDCFPSEVNEDITTVTLPSEEDLSLFELFVASLRQLYGDQSIVIHNWFKAASIVRVFVNTEYGAERCGESYCSIFIGDGETEMLEVLEQGETV